MLSMPMLSKSIVRENIFCNYRIKLIRVIIHFKNQYIILYMYIEMQTYIHDIVQFSSRCSFKMICELDIHNHYDESGFINSTYC